MSFQNRPKLLDLSEVAATKNDQTDFMNSAQLDAQTDRFQALVGKNREITASLPPRASSTWKGRTEILNENKALQGIIAEMKARATAPAASARPATPAAVRPATMQAARPAASAPNLLDQYSAMSAGPSKILFLARHGIAIQQLAKARAKDAR